jgi:hypothetical protein
VPFSLWLSFTKPHEDPTQKWVNKIKKHEMETKKIPWRSNPTILVFHFILSKLFLSHPPAILGPLLRTKREVVLYLCFFKRNLVGDGGGGG